MAGIGVKLNRIYENHTLTTNMIGFGYSMILTITPMVLVIAAVFIMLQIFDVASLRYADRELYSCTILYIFIFSLLTAAPFNSVLSRYISDVIYEENYADIIPCYHVGMVMNLCFSCLLGIPFCVREYLVGKVDILFVFAGFCGFVALVMVFYSMLYLNVCKDYKKISLYFLIGMAGTVLFSMLFVWGIGMEKTFSMLLALDLGFVIIAALEYALIHHYFRDNSGVYGKVFSYFGRYWQLVLTNFIYTLGLYVHNFVFWTTDLRMEVAESFVCVPVYDMATCIAMFLNISSTVIFISRVEMHFHERYKAYSEAVIGGRGSDIENTKSRMFRQLGEELFNLVRIQFIITLVIYFLTIIFLPRFGFGGMTMRIYPCLAVGYFILFIMYAAIIFLYYFNDNSGSLLTALVFLTITLVGTIFATDLSDVWYGIGLVAGALAGFITGYLRLRWLERNLDFHIFCNGDLIRMGKGKQPGAKVFDRYNTQTDNSDKRRKKP